MSVCRTISILVAMLGCGLPALAGAGAGRIEDNSFLIEEAYNQEPGVLHHISTFQRCSTTGEWLYTFTEEWPLGGEDHQISATLPIARTRGVFAPGTGIGDVQLHYRYALYQDQRAPEVSVIRLSLVFPTGARGDGLGEGRPGAQLAFPFSVRIGERFVEHVNLYGAWFPETWGGRSYERYLGYGAGNGLVWLTRPTFNLMLEVLWTEATRREAGGTRANRSLLVNPAFRSSIDFESGLQIVWGLGVPIGVGPSSGDRGLFLYLSFEHPFTARAPSGPGH